MSYKPKPKPQTTNTICVRCLKPLKTFEVLNGNGKYCVNCTRETKIKHYEG